jgi:TrmH family RNA methyltransferase
MHNLRVVLVRPKIAANMGAVARVMCNFGSMQLTLVAPQADPRDPRGRLLATHAEDLLEGARIVPELGDAVGDCSLVIGTSARAGGLFRRQSVGDPRSLAPRLVDGLMHGPAALVFGPESSGLSDAEVMRCHYLMRIPTDAVHPALNLAQAVAICLYEVRMAWLATSQRAEAPTEAGLPLAPFESQEHLFGRLREGLEAIHFLYGDKADALMHGIRHLLGKARLTDMEVKLLLGLARQMKWIAERNDPP